MKKEKISHEMQVEFNVTGLEKISSSLNHINKAEKGIKNLITFIGTLRAMQEEIKKLQGSGMFAEASKLATAANNAISQFNKLVNVADANILPSIKSRNYATGRSVTQKNKYGIATQRILAESASQVNPSLSGLLDAAKMQRLEQERDEASKRRQLQNKILIAELIEEKKIRDKQFADEQSQHERRVENNNKIIAQLIEEKKLRESQKRRDENNATIQSLIDEKKAREQAIKEEQDEASRRRRLQNSILIDQLINEKKQRQERVGFLALLKQSTAEFFSMEKIVSRISFVLTAKLSYESFRIVSQAIRSAIAVNIEFQDEMSKTFALMSGESKATKENLSQDVLSIAKTYRLNLKDVTDSIYEIISAQIKASDAASVLEAAVRVSIGGFADLHASTYAIINILNAFELEASKSTHIADIMFQVTKLGTIKVEEFADQMSKVASTASLFGMSIEEVSAMIATMTRNGIKTEQAFTSLNQLLMTIANPTNEAQKAMDAYGVSLDMNKVRSMGLVNAMLSLGDGFLNSEEAMTTLVKSRTGFKAFASLMQNASEYSGDMLSMIDSIGASTEAANLRLQTTKSLSKELATNATMLGQQFGKKIEPSIRSILLILSNSLGFLGKNMSNILSILKAIILQFVVLKAMKLYDLFSKTSVGIRLLTKNFKELFVMLKTFVSTNVVGLITVAVLSLASAFKNLSDKRNIANIDKALGTKDAEKNIAGISKEVDAISSKISQIEGLGRLVQQSDMLYKSMGNNKKLIAQFNAEQAKIVPVLEQIIGKHIDLKASAGNLSQYLLDLDAQYIASKQRILMLQMQSLNLETRAAMAESLKQMTKFGTEYAKQKSIFFSDLDDQRMYDAALNRVSPSSFLVSAIDAAKKNTTDFSRVTPQSSAQQIGGINLRVSNEISKLSKALNDPAYKKITQELSDLIVGYQGILSALEGNKLGNIESLLLTIKPQTTQPMKDIPTKSITDVDFLGKAKSFMSDIIGEGIYETPAELVNALYNNVIKLQDEMNEALKDGSKNVLNKAETENEIAKLKDIISSGNISDVADSGLKAIQFLFDTAKKLNETGNIAQAKMYYDRALTSFSSYRTWIDTMLKDENINKQFTASELKTLQDNIANGMAELFIGYVNGLKDTMNDEEFMKKMIMILGIQDIEFDYNALMNALDELEKSGQGQGIKANVIKNLTDGMVSGLEAEYKKVLGIVDSPEWISQAEDVLKQGVSGGQIKNKKDLKEAINKLSEANQAKTGIAFTDEEKATLGENVGKEFGSFDWKAAFGIKDYKNQNDMLLDMAQKTTAMLGNVWNNYFDWEIQKLEEQHEKKLDLMNREKDVMLANANVSADQREVIESRYNEKRLAMQAKFDKEMAAQKKKQAIFDATINLAQGLIGIWANALGKNPIFGAGIAAAASGLLLGLFAAQMAMIQKQKFASGGYTGSGFGDKDETGYRQAGIVHEGELVIDKKTLDRGNLNPMLNLYSLMKSGKGFDTAVQEMLLGKGKVNSIKTISSGMFASGGLVGRGNNNNNVGVIEINLNGAKVIDDIEMHKMVTTGGLKRRYING